MAEATADKPWLNLYPATVPREVDLAAYSNLADLIEEALTKYADRVAFHCSGTDLTYRELDRLSSAFAVHLAKHGFQKGDRFALMMPNVLQYPIALMGCLRLGLTVVNCNPLYTARELEHQLRDSGAKGILVIENFASVLAEVIDRTDVKHVVVTGLGDCLSWWKGPGLNFLVRHVAKLVPEFKFGAAIRFNSALSDGAGGAIAREALGSEDVAFLQYTGGTTGVSKGAILTHGNIVANVLQSRAWLFGFQHDERDECVIAALPLYHIFALTACTFVYVTMGAKVVLVTNPRDVPAFVRQLAQHKFTVLPGVNTLFTALMNHEDFAKLDFSALRHGLGGGMAVQRATAEEWRRVTGTPLIEAYGLTETSPGATINPVTDGGYNGSIGLPIPSTEVRLRRDDGSWIALDDFESTGEICIRGPQVMRGYYNRPEETEKVLDADGWLSTGDVGRMDANGFFYIVDRKKDMILVSGFNVYPNEVEGVVAMHPGVLEVAAIGVPDGKSGEVVKIFVVRKDPSLTGPQVLAHCRENMTGYKIPKYVEFRNELPKTNVGKILRRELRDEEMRRKEAA
ncbi:MAG TPA: AMP-binding protein [Casimicrobium huifangae]|jgi:long-chain acyl-CoA synthetase|uniref:AMP-binding protein n=1 Tax=Casimicrobium huifangae TaxID=2591109 RepID=UPI0012EC86DE|nr:AMP-binding protein [Casimicrobium huifangae]HOB02031.1 AMP-binding protein [Casimicrobium huifangae]HQA35278.1 AMP-binding protein [Casimicrobium huifangae]HQD65403.1 AMP-binding protein [Casimicrobium huifangae]